MGVEVKSMEVKKRNRHLQRKEHFILREVKEFVG